MFIDLSGDLTGFFESVVGETVRARGTNASDATVLYLVALLSDYAKPRSFKREVLREPFTFLLQRALESHGPERFERLRCLGDDVLYVAGFFKDHLENRGVEVDFVATLGSRAYDEAAAILRRARSGTRGPDVFRELSSNFDHFVEVVSDVSDTVFARSAKRPQEMLEVYERWLKTGSDNLAGALTDWGVLPRRGDSTLH